MFIKTIALIEKCPECRKELENGEWVVRETKVTTSRYCPPYEVKKRKEFNDFMALLDIQYQIKDRV